MKLGSRWRRAVWTETSGDVYCVGNAPLAASTMMATQMMFGTPTRVMFGP